MPTQTVKPPQTAPSTPLKPTGPPPKCIALDQPDGSISVSFLIEPAAAKRIRSRAQTSPLDRYIWENIIKRAVDAHVF